MFDPYDTLNTLKQRLQNSIDNMQSGLTEVRALQTDLAHWQNHQQPATAWVSVKDGMPQDDERVVVRTNEGAIYFLHAINGKFPANITHWFRLPQITI